MQKANSIPLPEWRKLLSAFKQSGGLLFLLGTTNSGKSTLITWLSNELIKTGSRVAIVDTDIGQSHIGPPGTIGLALPDQPFRSLESLDPIALHFVGATSPPRHLP